MLHLIPRSVHRLALKLAHRVRHYWRIWRKPELRGVTAILRDPRERTLLVMHSYGPRVWSLPGGGLKRGEEPETALRREIREELGVEVGRLAHIGTLENTISGCRHYAEIFTGIVDEAVIPDHREIVEARFFPAHSLPEPLGSHAQGHLDFALENMRAGGS